MNRIKSYLKYVNQWSVMFYALCFIQILTGVMSHDIIDSLWGVALIWVLYMLGYNSLDRELEIMLAKAREEMARDA